MRKIIMKQKHFKISTIQRYVLSCSLLLLLFLWLPGTSNADFTVDAGGGYFAIAGESFNLNGSFSTDLEYLSVESGWELDGFIPLDYNDVLGLDPLVIFPEVGEYDIYLMVSLYSDSSGYFNIASLIDTATVTVTESVSAPEPTTILLFGTGLIGLVGFRRRFQG